MKYRAEYVIGDLQGCYAAYLDLLKKIYFDPAQDK
ncbi:MAG TPA: symmetrical bis(5'-nucleosyl)-tetraphosphatase, partial [Psychrobacter pasteurii]|nr:symmetrical bis(5'-nucleosyl)-tetraphosphatase [Psychrobacter pasteurii]